MHAAKVTSHDQCILKVIKGTNASFAARHSSFLGITNSFDEAIVWAASFLEFSALNKLLEFGVGEACMHYNQVWCSG